MELLPSEHIEDVDDPIEEEDVATCHLRAPSEGTCAMHLILTSTRGQINAGSHTGGGRKVSTNLRWDLESTVFCMYISSSLTCSGLPRSNREVKRTSRVRLDVRS